MNAILYTGRFQPFHRGHMYVLSYIAGRFDQVFVVIGSANKNYTAMNPFTAAERFEMILKVVNKEKNKEKLKNVSVIPVMDIENPFMWYRYLDSLIPTYKYVAANDDLTKKLAEDNNKRIVEIPFYKRDLLSGSRIRSMMVSGSDEWKKLVDIEVLKILERINGVERVRKISKL